MLGRPVVEAPGHPDAEALGGAAALPAHDRLQAVNSLDHPYELLRLHQVEGDGPVHALPLWDDAMGDVPEHRGLDEAGLDAVLVQGLLGQGEMVRVPCQGVLLVQGEKTVLQGPLDGRFPGTDEEPVGFTLAQARLSDAEGEVPEVVVPVLHGDGCQPGLHHDPVRPGTVQFGQRALVGGAVLQGETVPEGSEALLLVTGEDAVAHRLCHALPEALLEGAVDVLAGGAGAVGDGPEGLPEGSLVEGVGTGGLGGELDHFLPAGLVGPAVLRVVPLQEAGLLAAETAGAL